MKPFIITICNERGEYPLNLDEGEQIDLRDYTCRAITSDYLSALKVFATRCPEYKTIVEMLEKGFELHIYKRNAH
ncbi:MAG: hypothetical protein ILP11_00825 [Alphaproteobacteria bacterium]|nr:hypothetical protein [Alphaproteobacteria bacterium]